MHVDELIKMGAEIKVDGRTAIVTGGTKLSGASVCATDLRAGAALICAALAADGNTEVGGLHHIERGYVNIVNKLAGLGAEIYRAPSPEDVIKESEKAALQPDNLMKQFEQRAAASAEVVIRNIQPTLA